VPTGAKVGIDATIGEGIPRERFERISYAYTDRAKIDDYYNGKADPQPNTTANADTVNTIAAAITAIISLTPKYYSEIAERFAEHDFQTIARALGQLHENNILWQDPRGRLCLRDSEFAAKPPTKA
jgi:2,5-furandicarboxylate decarboxylase 1